MIFGLLVLLIAFMGAYYIANNREVLSATLIMTAIYVVMVIFAIAARSYYDIDDISFKTVAIVMMSLVFFGIGEYAGRYGYFKEVNTVPQSHLPHDNEIYLSTAFTLIIAIFSIAVAYYSFTDIMRFAMRSGLVGDFNQVFSRLRGWITRGIVVYERGTLLNQLVLLDEAFCYMYVYILAHNYIYCKKVRVLYFFPVVPYFIVLFSTTGRTDFIEFFVVTAFIIFILLKAKHGWVTNVNRRIARIGLITLVAFYLVFRLAGRATMKTDLFGFVENIYTYFACSIYGFDSFITSNYSNSSFFGAQTLRSLYIILNLFKFNIPLVAQFNPEYAIGNTQTVMLTGLFRPILDYTVIGMLLTRVFVGFLYGLLIKKARRIHPHNFVAIVFVGYVFYPLVMNPLSDIFGKLMSFGILYRFFYLWIVNKYILRKHIREVEE